MKKIICALLCVIMIFCFVGCSGYSSPSDAARAFYKAYNAGDYKAVLKCYPEAARDYFIEAAGGEDEFSASVTYIKETGKISYEIVSEEPVSDTANLDSSLEHIGNLFEYTEASYINLKIYITFPDGTTSPEDPDSIEETQMVAVKVDGKWYIFDDVNYTDGTKTEYEDEQ